MSTSNFLNQVSSVCVCVCVCINKHWYSVYWYDPNIVRAFCFFCCYVLDTAVRALGEVNYTRLTLLLLWKLR